MRQPVRHPGWACPQCVETALPLTESLCYHPSTYLDFLCAAGQLLGGVQRQILGAMIGDKAIMGRADCREAARRSVRSPRMQARFPSDGIAPW